MEQKKERTPKDIVSELQHKVAQLEKAEQRLIEDNSTFQLNNWHVTRSKIVDLAMELAVAMRR